MTTLAACDAPNNPNTAAPMPPLASAPPMDVNDWASVRAQFAYDPANSHFAAFVFASAPASVRNAITMHRANFDHNPIEYLHANEGRYDQAIRMGAAGYLGVRADEIMFTDSTTMGLGMIYHGLKLRPGDEVLTTEHDFYATHESLRLRAARDGVTVRRVRLYTDPAAASVDEIVGNLVKAMTPATKVVAITWVHSGTGVKLPVRQIADALAGKALLVLDSVHGFGAVDAGPDQLGCDFLISGCHKWLFGPRGTGIVWGKPSAWAQFQPSIPTFDTRYIGAQIGFGGTAGLNPAATPGGYHAFEHQWALSDTFAFHQTVGRARIAGRIQELNTRLKEGLAGIKSIRVVTPKSTDLSAGIVCCDFGGSDPNAIVNRLRAENVLASVTPYRPTYVRFGASIVTMESDVDRAVAAAKKV